MQRTATTWPSRMFLRARVSRGYCQPSLAGTSGSCTSRLRRPDLFDYSKLPTPSGSRIITTRITPPLRPLLASLRLPSQEDRLPTCCSTQRRTFSSEASRSGQVWAPFVGATANEQDTESEQENTTDVDQAPAAPTRNADDSQDLQPLISGPQFPNLGATRERLERIIGYTFRDIHYMQIALWTKHVVIDGVSIHAPQKQLAIIGDSILKLAYFVGFFPSSDPSEWPSIGR